MFQHSIEQSDQVKKIYAMQRNRAETELEAGLAFLQRTVDWHEHQDGRHEQQDDRHEQQEDRHEQQDGFPRQKTLHQF